MWLIKTDATRQAEWNQNFGVIKRKSTDANNIIEFEFIPFVLAVVAI